MIGIFTIFYSVRIGKILNFTTSALIAFLIAYRMKKGVYNKYDMIVAFVHHGLAACIMLGQFAVFLHIYNQPQYSSQFDQFGYLSIHCSQH